MKSSHTNVIKMCMCMEWNGMSGDMTNSLPWIISLIYYYYFSWIWVIHFFWHALLACGIPSLGMHLFYFWHSFWACGIPSFGMHLFLIAHSINNMERMIMKQSRSFYFMAHSIFSNSKCRNFAHEHGHIHDPEHMVWKDSC